MRILMWFTIGFVAACIIGTYLSVSLLLAIFALVAAVALLFLRRHSARMIALILVGLSVGSFWCMLFYESYLNSAKSYDGKTIDATVVVSDYSYQTDYGVAADGKITLNGKEFSARVYPDQKISLKPGDSIRGSVRLRMTTNDSIQGQTYHQGDGIFLLGYVKENAIIEYCGEVPWRFFGAKMRHGIQNILKEAFSQDTLAFANALFLGDSSLLDYETDTNFKLSGIRHIVAVSGLHVSILLSIVFLICGRNRYLSAIIGIPLLLLFAAVVGFTPSVVRACIMQILMLVAMFLNREYDPPTSLSFAVLVMLIINPITIVSVSFQLSIGCIIGIFLLFDRINGYLLRLLRAPNGRSIRAVISRWVCSSVSITISTFVTTTPLSAMYFGSVSVVGMLTNLLTLWVVSFIFCGIAAVILAALIYLPIAKVIAYPVSFMMRYVIFISRLLADIPFSAVYTKSIYIVIWLIACYFLFAAMLFLRRKRPMLLAGCLAGLLVVAIAASWIEPKLDRYRVTVFDVGEGQSILVQYHSYTCLIDCGSDSDRVAADTVSQHLLSMGIYRLDCVVVTHYDRDHAGGIPNLLTSVPADTLYLPDVQDESGIKNSLAAADATIHWITDLKRLKIAGMEMALLPGEHPTSDNERSMCVLLNIEDYDILITGDRSAAGEKALLRSMSVPQVDVLVVGHHGADSATSLELLKAVKPAVAVISTSRDNHYGHPSENVLYRLRLFGCSIWRTDIDGTIIFRG